MSERPPISYDMGSINRLHKYVRLIKEHATERIDMQLSDFDDCETHFVIFRAVQLAMEGRWSALKNMEEDWRVGEEEEEPCP